MSRTTAGLLALTVVAGGADRATAQEPPLAPVVLRLPSGTRALGMGNAFTAGRGPDVVFYNPAQMLQGRGSGLAVTRIGSHSTLGSASTVGALGAVAVGAGLQYLRHETPSPGSPFISPPLLTAGGPVASASLAAVVAAGLRWKGIRWGAAVRYVEEHVGGERDGGVTADLGAAREVGRVTLAVAVQHLGSGLALPGAESELPTLVSIGAAIPTISFATYFDFNALASVSVARDGRILPGGGAELSVEPVGGWTIALRAGARRRDERPFDSSWAPTLGAAFGLDRVALEYGFEPTRGPGATHRVGIRIQ